MSWPTYCSGIPAGNCFALACPAPLWVGNCGCSPMFLCLGEEFALLLEKCADLRYFLVAGVGNRRNTEFGGRAAAFAGSRRRRRVGGTFLREAAGFASRFVGFLRFVEHRSRFPWCVRACRWALGSRHCAIVACSLGPGLRFTAMSFAKVKKTAVCVCVCASLLCLWCLCCDLWISVGFAPSPGRLRRRAGAAHGGALSPSRLGKARRDGRGGWRRCVLAFFGAACGASFDRRFPRSRCRSASVP